VSSKSSVVTCGLNGRWMSRAEDYKGLVCRWAQAVDSTGVGFRQVRNAQLVRLADGVERILGDVKFRFVVPMADDRRRRAIVVSR
jgi:hypothetical protein